MRFKLILSVIAVVLLVVSCFLPWMTIESKGITITGLNTTGTLYGKPGYFHFLWAGLYLLFLLINKVWSKRTAVGMAAFNIAWTVRNFFLVPACQMGECPIRKEGLYLLLAAAILMFVAPVLPEKTKDDVPIPGETV
ncbi:MAG: hypothetical protein EOO10_05895 [Chitinophagaceae bacterium]|nr:MAG: hypothetical protein EOO10_05895 [Chitinophagaceae bacterium]